MSARVRKMGIWTATALVVGNIVGAAIFMQPAALAPYGWNAVTAWIISLTGALCLAWVFAKLAGRFPDAGGAHAFMQMGVGDDLAFLGSWGYLVSIWAANAAICITGTSYLTRLIPALRTVPSGELVASLVLLVVLTWGNTRALGGRVQLVSSIIKLLPFTAVIALAAWTLFDEGLASVTPVIPVPVTPATTLAAIGITFYAMLGLESAAVPADAVDDPARIVPRATMIGTTLSGLVTLFSTGAVALMLPLAVVVNSKAPVADFIGSYWGDGASLFVAFGGVVSAYGALNGWILIGGEMPAAMTARGSLPAWFGARNALGVPSRAVILGSVITGVLLVLASSRVGVAAFNFTALIATATNLVLYLFCSVAAIRFMADGRLARTPGLMLCALGAVVFSLYAFYGSGWEPLAYGAVLVAAGWPLHKLAQRIAARGATVASLAVLGGACAVALAALTAARAQAQARQTDADAYTRYELLTPGSGKFRILYEITATTPGATHYFNPIRPGSVASDESVVDRATGRPLRFAEVDGAVARAGGVSGADTAGRYIDVTLAQPVPAEGEGRILIDKTYRDTASYVMRGDTIIFTRSLGIKRNAVVLPAGYELVASNFPSQVLEERDGRIGVSFWNNTPSAAPLVLRAVPRRTGAASNNAGNATDATNATNAAGDRRVSSMASRLGERASQSREITYVLRQPETHAFDLFHDYTETRAGVATYLNVVRAGSTVSEPHARNLDTGDTLAWEVLTGEAIRRAGLDVPDVTPTTEVVVFRFPPVPAGGTTRIRMYETYTDAARYRLEGDELVWDRGFGRPINTVVLPLGWMLTNSSIPSVVRTRADGRAELEFVNPRPDAIQVLITARRR